MVDFRNKQVKALYYFADEGARHGLKILFEFDEDYLLFDNANFLYGKTENSNWSFKWVPFHYPKITNGVSIVRIREDECTSYFLELSNNDILYIFQLIDGEGFYGPEFKIINKSSHTEYVEVVAYMNEDFVTDALVNAIN